MSRPIVAETLPTNAAGHAIGTFTPLKVTVVDWALGTPVRFTAHWFEFGPLLSVPCWECRNSSQHL